MIFLYHIWNKLTYKIYERYMRWTDGYTAINAVLECLFVICLKCFFFWNTCLLFGMFVNAGFRLWSNGHAHTRCLNKKDFHLIHWWTWTTWASHVVSEVLPHSSLKSICFLQKRNNNYHIIISNNKNNSTKTIATKIDFHNIPFEPAANMLWIFLLPQSSLRKKGN